MEGRDMVMVRWRQQYLLGHHLGQLSGHSVGHRLVPRMLAFGPVLAVRPAGAAGVCGGTVPVTPQTAPQGG